MSSWKLIKSRVEGKIPSINQVDEDTLAFNQFDAILYALRVRNGVKQVVAIGGSGISEPGADGREIELRESFTHIQWRYVGDEDWINLVELAELIGPQGPQGETGGVIDQQQADWEQTNEGNVDFIKNKPEETELPSAELPSQEIPSIEIYSIETEIGTNEEKPIEIVFSQENNTQTIVFDESKVNHNNLLNYETERHRHMVYVEGIKAYLINE